MSRNSRTGFSEFAASRFMRLKAFSVALSYGSDSSVAFQTSSTSEIHVRASRTASVAEENR